MNYKKYIYDNVTYTDEKSVRAAVFKKSRVIFGNIINDQQWKKYGVEVANITLDQTFEQIKQSTLNAIKVSFTNWLEYKSMLTSSLGFRVNSTERAYLNVTALLSTVSGTVKFKDGDDEFRTISHEQLQLIYNEMSLNRTNGYEQKWGLEEKVNQCSTVEQLNAVVIEFNDLDFSKR